MEITLEKIDSLRERANVSYAEAKDALEKSGGNMIDAIISLEGENKTVYDRAKKAQSRQNDSQRINQRREQYKTNADDFVESSKKLVQSLNETRVIMYNSDRVVFDISMTVTLIATVFAFPLSAAIFVIGLLTGNKYKIVRKDKKADIVNSVLDKAAKVSKTVTDNLKEKVNDVQGTDEFTKKEYNTEE